MQHPTSMKPLSVLLAGLVLSVAASGAMAQVTPAPTNSTNSTNSTTVGVTPQDAAEASRKAVPRADTGTLVRTGDTATDKAKMASDKASSNATPAPMPAATAPAANAAPNTMTTNTAPAMQRTKARAPRADRN